MSVWTVHEKDGNAPGQLTVFDCETWANIYAEMRENQNTLMIPIESQRPEISVIEHIMPETFKLKSGMTVFTTEIVNNISREFYMFSSKALMDRFIESLNGDYKFATTREYKIKFISSRYEALQYANVINGLLEWRVKLGTVSRFGKKNCIISNQDMEAIGFDPASETVEEFIARMRPIAEKMYDVAKKQLRKLNPDRRELNYISPIPREEDDDDESS